MKNRTYRYFKGTPLYPFGYGLSYTRFGFFDLTLSSPTLTAGQPLTVTATSSPASAPVTKWRSSTSRRRNPTCRPSSS